MCVYVVQYLYNEYDIVFLKFHLTVSNIAYYVVGCFIILFLTPYFFTNSIDMGRVYFSIPVSAICLYICWAFFRRISNFPSPNTYIIRRNKLSLLTITCIAILPILTVIGDYQWLTFSVINIAFYAISAIEIDRYLYLLEHKSKLDQVLLFYKDNQEKFLKPKFLNKGLTRREIEITMSILERRTYREIGDDFFIAESTLSKHASNIFKKMNVRSRAEFETRFVSKK